MEEVQAKASQIAALTNAHSNLQIKNLEIVLRCVPLLHFRIIGKFPDRFHWKKGRCCNLTKFADGYKFVGIPMNDASLATDNVTMMACSAGLTD